MEAFLNILRFFGHGQQVSIPASLGRLGAMVAESKRRKSLIYRGMHEESKIFVGCRLVISGRRNLLVRVQHDTLV